MNNIQVHGEIQTIRQVQKITDNFCKREFVLIIDQDKPYPQTIQFELHNDRTDIIDAYGEGDQVSVDFMLKGRSFQKDGETRTMNTLVCWKIQPVNK